METIYRRKKYLANEYGISVRTVERRIDWILAHADRYPEGAVIHNGRITFAREDVFEDCIKNGNKIDAGFNPVFVEGKG